MIFEFVGTKYYLYCTSTVVMRSLCFLIRLVLLSEGGWVDGDEMGDNKQRTDYSTTNKDQSLRKRWLSSVYSAVQYSTVQYSTVQVCG